MRNSDKAFTVYVGASLLNTGAQMQNEIRKGKILEAGLEPYLPQDDKSINDKANAVQEGLAERIVNKDFGAIDSSDVILFDVLETTGTTTEIGYVFGQKRLASQLLGIINTARDEDYASPADILTSVEDFLRSTLEKPVIMTSSDVRRANNNPQVGDRREWSINQLLYGVILALTGGQGFTEEEDLQQQLTNIKELY